MPNTSQTKNLPTIIQGGMGIAVSSWKLARRVAELGQFGVVSGTAIDSVVIRELQDGDPYDRLGWLTQYPDQDTVDDIRDTFFLPEGRAADQPYKLLPIHKFRPTVRSQKILCAAAYSEVTLAKQGHDGLIGINLLAKMKRYTLPCVYGAMLAGVDAILMGAGIPIEESEQLNPLAEGLPGRLRLQVERQSTSVGEQLYYEFDPSVVVAPPPKLSRPMFFPIVASDALARIMDKKVERGLITGWIIEGPVAGGHNAPPRSKNRDEDGTPIYDERDNADLKKIAALGLPFYLAGGYGSPNKLQTALELGATGVQIGSLFSLADESGYPADTKEKLIQLIHEKKAIVRTDGRVSSTGFPFKVLEVEGTVGDPSQYYSRTRICDLGYLQEAFMDDADRLQVRCPAEPVNTWLSKGGDEADTSHRGCLCNGLMANIGLPQVQKTGVELPLFTAGDDILALPLGSETNPRYSAKDVLEYLLNP